jgi:hypothetical protein
MPDANHGDTDPMLYLIRRTLHGIERVQGNLALTRTLIDQSERAAGIAESAVASVLVVLRDGGRRR